MSESSLTVALIREVFTQQDARVRLEARLMRAVESGADLAILPELPYHAWSPATRNAIASDAERPGGRRESMQSKAARIAKMAVLGGVIQIDREARFNRAIFSDKTGTTIARYDKVHIPDEEGFRETCHYAPGRCAPTVFAALGARFGIQICSDANRLVGSHLLAAQGVQVILAPRASSQASWPKWKLVYRAMAMTCAAWVISVGRPDQEFGVPIGGPALIVDPMGRVVVESMDIMTTYTLDLISAATARNEYPGYLDWPAELYEAGWAALKFGGDM